MQEISRIESRSNERIKHARSVREGRIDGLIFVEGVRLVRELVASHIPIVDAYITDVIGGGLRHDDLIGKLLDRADNAFRISDSVAESLSDTKTPQGVFALARRPGDGLRAIEAAIREPDAPIVVLLDRINNPSNLGAVFRTAEAAGASGAILTLGSTDPFSPKALRASMGAAFRLPVWEGPNADEVVEWARTNSLWPVAADIARSVAYTEADWKKPRLLVLGSEADGLDAKLLDSIDDRVFIPMTHGVESLNLAVACGVILFEAKRQREAR